MSFPYMLKGYFDDYRTVSSYAVDTTAHNHACCHRFHGTTWTCYMLLILYVCSKDMVSLLEFTRRINISAMRHVIINASKLHKFKSNNSMYLTLGPWHFYYNTYIRTHKGYLGRLELVRGGTVSPLERSMPVRFCLDSLELNSYHK